MALLKINLFGLVFILFSCAKDTGVVDQGSNYPKEVASILLSKCATNGCHNQASKDASSGLSLVSWEDLFLGARGGPVVIPYRPDFSTLCFFTNTLSALGPVSVPTMPLGTQPLSDKDYMTLKNWILQGAPGSSGNIKFKDNLNRSKIYITNQLCDIVIAVDAESRLPMRYIDVGVKSQVEFPICIKVSNDKKYWYVTFLASSVIQKFDASNDSYVAQADLGEGVWSSFELTSDSKYAFCIDNSNPGKIAYVDLGEMKVLANYNNPAFIYPKAAAINNNTNKLYIGAENGNYISVIDFNDTAHPSMKQVILDGSSSISNQSSNDPGSLLINEFYSLCYIACRNSNEIKIMDLSKDSVIASVFLNASPTFMDYFKSKNNLFITCTDDTLSFPNNRGSVKVIDLNINQVIKTINPGYQPNGICINSQFDYAAIVNSNISPKGPGPHHTSGCAGRDGYLTFITLSTFEMISSAKYELAVYPFAAAMRP
jgi:YVTN family beta-propeller protein